MVTYAAAAVGQDRGDVQGTRRIGSGSAARPVGPSALSGVAAFGVPAGAARSFWCCPGKTAFAGLLASALARDGVVGEGGGLERSNRLDDENCPN